MKTRVIEVLRSWSFVTRGRAATRTAPTTACATLDAAAQTINHARNHRDEDDCADNDTNDDGPSNLSQHIDSDETRKSAAYLQ